MSSPNDSSNAAPASTDTKEESPISPPPESAKDAAAETVAPGSESGKVEAKAAPDEGKNAEKLADGKGKAPAASSAAVEEVKSVPPPEKKQWGDVDFNEELDSTFEKAMKLGGGDGEADKPEIALKSETLNEDVEAPETEIRKILASNTPYTSAKTFEELSLSENLLRGIYSEMKFEKPSRIQGETLPLILSPPYRHLIAQAHNGSGKTTCFVLGMLGRVDMSLKAPQAMCVCPTRELVIQNEDVLLKLGKYTGATSATTAVAENRPSISSSRRDQIVDQIVIGTPGTLKRWMTRDKILSARDIKVLVFDEADHMLDQDGFQDDSLRIINNIKQQNKSGFQILLFSATFSERVKAFAKRVVQDANWIFVDKEKLSLDVIKQYRVRCPNETAKITVIKDRIFPAAERLGQSIIFVRTRQSASYLHKSLEADGFKCTSIQGGLSYEERDKVIKEFRSGETKILISTDVLARGFDQAQVTLVVNFDIPTKLDQQFAPDFELYLHRIGRSGRFGRKGAAFNLTASAKEANILNEIADHFQRQIPEVAWDNDDQFEMVLKEAGLA